MPHVTTEDQSLAIPTSERAWPLLQRIGFRFSFCYLILSSCFWVFEFSDKSAALLGKPYLALWHPIVQLVAHHLFHWPGAIEPNFVRDTRYLYSLLFCLLIFSVLVSAIWSVFDRGRTEYGKLHGWLRIFLRYVLAYLMLHYGMDKVFLLQFPAPGWVRLTESFGEYSPSSLMWAFIGSSVPFTIFGGLAEISGALLLLFRRTTTLGALITFAVMFNVTVMDFSYDVSVKLFCLNLLLMSLFLILPDASRLVNFFFLNRATQPATLAKPRINTSRRAVVMLLKVCVILYLIVPLTLRDWKNYRMSGAGQPHPPYYGLYVVDGFTLSGDVHPPLITDQARWRYVIFDTPNTLTIKLMDDSVQNYAIKFDADSKRIAIEPHANAAGGGELTVSQPDQRQLDLRGTFNGAPLLVSMHPVDKSRFPLISRGFHWINESSFVR